MIYISASLKQFKFKILFSQLAKKSLVKAGRNCYQLESVPPALEELPDGPFGTVTVAETNGNQKKYVSRHQNEQFVFADP